MVNGKEIKDIPQTKNEQVAESAKKTTEVVKLNSQKDDGKKIAENLKAKTDATDFLETEGNYVAPTYEEFKKDINNPVSSDYFNKIKVFSKESRGFILPTKASNINGIQENNLQITFNDLTAVDKVNKKTANEAKLVAEREKVKTDLANKAKLALENKAKLVAEGAKIKADLAKKAADKLVADKNAADKKVSDKLVADKNAANKAKLDAANKVKLDADNTIKTTENTKKAADTFLAKEDNLGVPTTRNAFLATMKDVPSYFQDVKDYISIADKGNGISTAKTLEDAIKLPANLNTLQLAYVNLAKQQTNRLKSNLLLTATAGSSLNVSSMKLGELNAITFLDENKSKADAFNAKLIATYKNTKLTYTSKGLKEDAHLQETDKLTERPGLNMIKAIIGGGALAKDTLQKIQEGQPLTTRYVSIDPASKNKDTLIARYKEEFPYANVQPGAWASADGVKGNGILVTVDVDSIARWHAEIKK